MALGDKWSSDRSNPTMVRIQISPRYLHEALILERRPVWGTPNIPLILTLSVHFRWRFPVLKAPSMMCLGSDTAQVGIAYELFNPCSHLFWSLSPISFPGCALMLTIWDILITLDKEVTFVWSNSPGLPHIILALTRYCNLVSLIYANYCTSPFPIYWYIHELSQPFPPDSSAQRIRRQRIRIGESFSAIDAIFSLIGKVHLQQCVLHNLELPYTSNSMHRFPPIMQDAKPFRWSLVFWRWHSRFLTTVRCCSLCHVVG